MLQKAAAAAKDRGCCGFPIFYPYRHEGYLLQFNFDFYNCYWLFTVAATYFMIVFTPFEIAFAPFGDLGAPNPPPPPPSLSPHFPRRRDSDRS